MNHFNIEVTPILTLSQNNALCNIIKLDGITMMFDCGWNENFSKNIQSIYNEKINMKIDYIYLSSNSMSSIGGLPYLLKMDVVKDAKVFATTPVSKLGFYVMVDSFISMIEISEHFNFITDSDICASFLNINEVKFKENIKLPHKNTEIVITPLPSGSSLGGCCWKINYKLHTILYAPQISINFKYVCDAFPYELLKGVDIFITDSLATTEIPVIKTEIEKEFRNNILEEIEKQKNIFIPSDSANINVELLIRLEKILDEYYFKKKEQSVEILKTYKVLVCGHSSTEIVDNIKSLIEFLGTSISQQFYSYNDNPFNLQYVHCIKDVKEFLEIKKSNNVIVISSFESLDLGISNKLLPEILSDENFRVFLVHKGHKYSLLRKILKNYKDGMKIFYYDEIKRIVDHKNKIEENKIADSHKLEQGLIEKENGLNKLPEIHNLLMNDLSIKKKLFAKGPYPMFAYHKKKKLNEYGIELTEKELKIMKSVSEEKTEVFESGFKTFLYMGDKILEDGKQDIRLKIKRQDLFYSAHYEKSTRPIKLNSKFSFYDLFEFDGIDAISKEIIIQEIQPKDEIIFLGELRIKGYFKGANFIENILSKLPKLKYRILNNYDSEIVTVKDNLINLKYDSSILNKLPNIFVKDYGFVYDLKNTFLKVKTKRKEIQNISILDPSELLENKLNYENSKTKINTNVIQIGDKDENLDYFYTKSDLKLINLKREISKLLNEEFFVFKNYITNVNQDFKLYIEKNELILEGNLNPAYLKIRNCIYSNFINIEEI